ncbi:winged helix-turn-helix transcriptional regulator [Methanofollis ethanolicus]|uniref:winged helix-turn-helix transcriptional regulator n=1 Tax=Methanofollis ethanolicus TaxID=488124 RepID=UPI00082991DB|nr:winged helix-turn-helix transcriptional regulator [Methanofollis ethanolicus]
MGTESLTLFRFSPEKIPKDKLRELFVGREKQLDNLVRDVGEAAKEYKTRFHLIIGPRGIGKSHFMVMAYYDLIEKYGSTVIPIKFAEEEYSIYRASDFFLRALDEYNKTYKKADITIPTHKGEDFVLDFALGKLEEISRTEKKQFVFLIENLNEIFLQLEKNEVAKLRSIFQKYDIFSVVASAPMIFPGVSEHDEPFFNFFRIDHLREFSLAESKQFLRRIGEVEKNEQFLQNFEKYEPKLEGIYHLTGGSPRLVIIIYEIINSGNIENIETIFLKMLDDYTPYYQKIFEMLSGQRRMIFDTLMLSPTPLTPKDIAEKTRIDVNTINTQLRRLDNDGYIRSHPMGKRTSYEVRERLFRLWREMRQPFGRNRISIFIDFLSLWYTPEERENIFKTKFALLKAGDTSVLRDVTYFFDAIPPERKIERLNEYISTIYKFGTKEDLECTFNRLKREAERLDPKLSMSVLHNEGIIALQSDNGEKAYTAAESCLAIDPNDTRGHFIKSMACLLLGNHEDAIDSMRCVIESSSGDPRLNTFFGNMLLFVGRKEEALAQADKALSISPNNIDALTLKGNILDYFKKYEEIVDIAEKVLHNQPDNIEALTFKIHGLYFLGKSKECLETIDLLLTIQADNKDALFFKMVALHDLEKYDESLASADAILSLNLDDCEKKIILEVQLVALINLQKYYEALVVADTILEDDPESLGTLVLKLMIVYNLEKREEAVILADHLYPDADKISPERVYPYTNILLSLGFDEYGEGNYGYGKKHISRAYEIESKRHEEFDLKDDTIESLKEIIDTGDPELIRMVTDTIIEAKGEKNEEYRWFIKPITDALMIIETGDTSLYYRILQSEERDLVADIVKKIMKSDVLMPDSSRGGV